MFSRNAPDADAHIGQTLPTSNSPQNRPSKTTKKSRAEFKRKRGGLTSIKWNGSWLWEISSVFLSVVCLALLVAFLVKINGTPYGTWEYTASPNTVISVITTIAKTSLLVSVSACLSQLKWNQYQGPTPKPLYSIHAIDQASRGPWGSLEVLLAGIFKLRVDVLTLAGAFITIIALAIDPFAQQILSFPERTVQVLNSTASLPYAQTWNKTQYIMEGGIDSSLLPSLIIGLAQEVNPLSSQCDASTCNFPEAVTMGVCSHCEDISDQMTESCGPAPNQDDTWLLFGVHGYCNYSLPVPELGIQFPNETFRFSALPSADIHVPNNETVTLGYRLTVSRPFHVGTIYDGALLNFFAAEAYQNVTWTQENKTAVPPRPKFSQCTMNLCEQRFSPYRYVATDQASHFPKITQTQQLITGGSSTLTSQGDTDVKITPPNGTEFLANNAPYYVSEQFLAGMKHELETVFNITSTIPDPNGLNLYPIFNERGFKKTLESVSTAFSNNLRSSTNPLAKKVAGTPFMAESYIKVRWPWIILPIFTTLASILLLIGTLIASKAKHAILWKDSVIPLLMSNLRTYPDHEISVLRDATEVNNISKTINVSLSQDNGPLTFTEK